MFRGVYLYIKFFFLYIAGDYLLVWMSFFRRHQPLTKLLQFNYVFLGLSQFWLLLDQLIWDMRAYFFFYFTSLSQRFIQWTMFRNDNMYSEQRQGVKEDAHMHICVYIWVYLIIPDNTMLKPGCFREQHVNTWEK